ncbi:beta strand repeat-containing protein [Alteromonas mediterranea]|uniref:beta strand repeat-containing protein n=1 Tax=Alteromonas mediterranea TaxID=314275 RepID=UPI0032B10444
MATPISNERLVNSIINNSIGANHTAAFADGSYITVWHSTRDVGNSYGIYAQRFNANGTPIGHEFQVNVPFDSYSNQQNPKVTTLADGSFAVTWHGAGEGDGAGIFARHFNASGEPTTGNVLINEDTSSTQDYPDIATLDDGNIVIGWRSNSSNNPELVFRAFDSSLTPVSTEQAITVQGDTTTYYLDISAHAGGFAATWYPSSNNGVVRFQQFNNELSAEGPTVQVGVQTGGDQDTPKIEYFSNGDFVVVWEENSGFDGSGDGVYAQLFNADGTNASGVFLVNTTTSSSQNRPDVAVLDDDTFVVTWDGRTTLDGNFVSGIVYQQFAQDGTPIGIEMLATTASNSNGSQYTPDITALSNGEFVITWDSDSFTTDDGAQAGIVQRVFSTTNTPVLDIPPEIVGMVEQIVFDENVVNAAPQIIDIAVAVVDTDTANYDGGELSIAYVVGGSSEDSLSIRNQGTGSSQIGVSGNQITYEGNVIGTIVENGDSGSNLLVNLTSNANVESIEALLENVQYANSSQSPQATRTISIRLDDGAGNTSSNVTTEIIVEQTNDSIASVGTTERVNTYTNSVQSGPSISKFDDGSFIVVWDSYSQNDTNNYGILAQRFSASGEPVGLELQINQSDFLPSDSTQQHPDVTTFSDGSFMVTWDGAGQVGQDGSGIYGRIFNADGTPATDDFQVNQYTSSTQSDSQITRLSNGNVAVTWQSAGADGSGWSIVTRIFDSNGAPVTDEIVVNSTTTSTQYEPSVDSFDGGYIVGWYSSTQAGGSSSDVVARAVNNDGTFASAELDITLGQAGDQLSVEVNASADGSYVLTWVDNSGNADGSGYGIVAQKFDASHSALTAQIVINENSSSTQYRPDIAQLDNGNYVFTWHDANLGSIMRREFTSDLVPIDSELRVESNINTSVDNPAVIGSGNNYFIAFEQSGIGFDSTDISLNRFGSFADATGPEITGFASSYNFDEALVNAGLVPLELGVSVADVSGAGFDGGTLTVGYNVGSSSDDQLGLLNQGNAAGQVGVSGSSVFFEGTQIGTLFSDGQSGSQLVITFNANATTEAVEGVLEATSYRNTSNSPEESRSISLRLTDANGASSENIDFSVNVSAEIDSTVPAFTASLVNTFTDGVQYKSDIAAFDNGSYVVVWQSEGQENNNGVYSIHGQRFGADGNAIGTEFLVSQESALTVGQSDNDPKVTTFSDGSYVVVWQGLGTNDSVDIKARLFDANGSALGDEFQVNDFVSSSQEYPDVVRLSDGNFAVTWPSAGGDGNSWGVSYRIFQNDGTAVTNELVANTTVTGTQYSPSIDATSAGFAITWYSDNHNGSTSNEIIVQQFANDGTLLGSEIEVTSLSAGNQATPKISYAADGSFVVVWEDTTNLSDGSGSAILAQRYDASGSSLGQTFVVNENPASSQYSPSIDHLPNGNFVITWYSANSNDIFRREFSSDGQPLDGDQLVNIGQQSGTQTRPSVASLGNGDYVITYHDQSSADGSSYGIFQSFFGSQSTNQSPTLAGFTNEVTFAENAVNNAPQILDAAVSFQDSDSTNFEGGVVTLGYIQFGGVEDQLGVNNQGNGLNQIGVSGSTISYSGTVIGNIVNDGQNGATLRIELNINATHEAIEALVQNLTYANTSEAPNAQRTLSLNVEDGDGGSTGNQTITVNVSPDTDGSESVFGPDLVNTFTAGGQFTPDVASFADGSYVVTWVSSTQDDSSWGVYAQRFDANGLAVGNEFLVNTTTASTQSDPAVTVLSDNSFVITWEGNGISDGNGVFAQRYASDGAPVGSEFLLRDGSDNTETLVDVVALSDGKFATTWTDGGADASGWGISVRIFNADGTPAGASFTANTTTSSTQYNSSISSFSGGFVVSWYSTTQAGGDSSDIVMQRFDNNGNAIGSEIDLLIDGSQQNNQVAAFSDGSFVVVFQSTDGSSDGVFAQRYNADGTANGDLIQVNETLTGNQTEPSVATLPNGNFVVGWTGNGVGDNNGAFIREFDSNGVPIDGEVLASSTSVSSVDNISLTGLGSSNNFIAVWADSSLEPDDSSWGVFQNIFGNPSDFNRSTPPSLDDITDTRQIVNSVASTPVRIDADVDFTHISDDFDGGMLEVFYLTQSDADDLIAIETTGTGLGQISISGSDVSFEGTAIGQISSGENGANGNGLSVTFNASATTIAIDALIEHLTYASQNNVENDETISIRVTDGNGVATQGNAIFIDIRSSVSAPDFLMEDFDRDVTFNESDVVGQLALLDSNINFEYKGSNSLDGGYLTLRYISNNETFEDTLGVANIGTGNGQISVSGSTISYEGTAFASIYSSDNGEAGNDLRIDFTTGVTDEAVEALIEALGYSSDSGALNPRSVRLYVYDSANNYSTNIDYSLQFEQAVNDFDLVGEPSLINQVTAGNQTMPSASELSGGGYVVTWTGENGLDGSSNGIFAQIFDENGQAVGNQFVVNTENFGNQTNADVAGLSDGSFVVVWQSVVSESNSDINVYAQRFTASGQALGDQFIVNENLSSTQGTPVVTALATGGFVVAFDTYDSATGDTSGIGIGMRFFDNAGVATTAELLANTSISGSQSNADLAASASAVVATWKSNSGDDVFARIFNPADGTELVSEFKVNTSEGNVLNQPAVTALDDGTFVLVWGHYIDEFAKDFWGFRGQRIDANGNFIGDEFIVNTSETSWNSNDGIDIASLNNGNFAVTWGANAGVYVQEFEATGTTPTKVDGPVLAGSGPSTDHQSTIVSVGNQSAAVIWSGYNLTSPANSTYEIGQQLVGVASDFSDSDGPQIENIPAEITITESTNTEFIFSNVDILDSDSPDFDGGLLTIDIVSGYRDIVNTNQEFADDNFTIENQGVGQGQISVSGSTVSYAGAAIGTIAQDGQAGNGLHIALNTNATLEAVNALIQAIGYSNLSTSPQASREVALRLTDGDGGSSANQVVTLNITEVANGSTPQTSDIQANSFELGNQTTPALAEMSSGGFVMVWTSDANQDGNGQGIFAQRYSDNGAPVGNEIAINTSTLSSQSLPSVAANGNGFVVAWSDTGGVDGSGYGIVAQRFDEFGEPIGGEFVINETTSSTQNDPQIIQLSSGGFAAVWEGNGVGDSSGVFGRLFNEDGTPLSAEFLINESTSGSQFDPSITELASGQLAVTYESSNQITIRLVNADGTTLAPEIIIDRPVTTEREPDITALSNGNFVVSYTINNDGNGSGVFAQLFDSSGNVIGDEIRVNEGITGNQSQSKVDALATGGFIVSYYSSASPDGIFTQEFDADGNAIDGNNQVNLNNVSTDWEPAVLGLSSGGYITAWSGYNVESEVNGSYGVFWRGFGSDGQFSDGAGRIEIAGLPSEIILIESDTPEAFIPSADLFGAESNDFNGGSLTVTAITGYGAQGQFVSANEQDNFSVLSSGNGLGEISVSGSTISYEGTAFASITKDGANGNELHIDFNASANQASINALLQALSYLNSSDGPTLQRTISLRLTDGEGNSTSNNAINFVVEPVADGASPQGDEIQVNTYQENEQRYSEVTELEDGSLVVVWQSQNQDGWGSGIVGQRFDANGSPIGNEFIVNQYTPEGQTYPSVTAVAGGFVVAWEGRGDDDGSGIFGRLFDLNGVQQSDDFIINDTLSSTQSQVRLTSMASGGFAAIFSGNGVGDNSGTFLTTFDANGNRVINETLANAIASGTQSEPDITELANGKLVVTYRTGSDIEAQIFNNDGSAFSGAITVADTSDSEYQPKVAALDNGGFVVTYTDNNDTSNAGVFAQLFDANGQAVGELLRVNEQTSGAQYEPDVTALVGGGFAVSYLDSNNPDSIFVQQFDNDGRIVDGPKRAETNNINGNDEPSITALSNGGFAVTWTSYNTEPDQANSYGILMRMFGSDGQFETSQAPVVEIASNSIEFSESSLNFAPQLLLIGAGVADIDTTDFTNGQLEIARISSYGQGDQLGRQPFFPQDNLGIQNQGSGSNEIAVYGSDVLYEGTVIGTLDSSGTNDTALVVTFNANASAQAIESLLEAVTYRNTSDAPESTRTYSVRLTDGAGGSSIAQSIVVNISQNLDGNLPTLQPERVVNTDATGGQSESQTSALYDSNGALDGYVVSWQGSQSGDVHFQLYDNENNPVGSNQVANTTLTNSQNDITVQSLNNGTFVMTWTSTDSSQDGSGSSIIGRIFNNDGSPFNQAPHNGAEFVVNTEVSSTQSSSQIAVLPNGEFAVVWQTFDSDTGDNSSWGVAMQRFDGTGQALGDELLVNTTVSSSQSTADISALASSTALPDGGYAVSWQSPDANSSGIFAQVFDANGNTVGSEFQVNTTVTGSQTQSAVAGLANGDFVITWTDNTADLSNSGVYAQRFTFNAAGESVAIGDEFRVNQDYLYSQYDPSIVALSGGGFAIAFTGNDGNGDGVFVQEFDQAGRLIDLPQLINQNTSNSQNESSLAALSDGGFIASWTSWMGGTEGYDVFMQRFGNQVPQTTDFVIQGSEDENIIIDASEFLNAFVDPEGESLQEVAFITLPISGVIALNGIAITPGQILDINALQTGVLTYLGDQDFNGLDSFTWAGSDGANFAEPATTNITVLPVNDAPGMSVGADDTGTESYGIGFSHTINFNDPDGDTLLVNVDWGDGETSQYTTNSGTLNTGHRYLDNGVYTVTVMVDDQSGTAEAIETQTYQATISNVAPSIGLFGNNDVEQDQVYTLRLGNPSDPGDDTVTDFIVDWGDGTVETFNSPGDVTHVYATPGDYEISIDLVDEDGTYEGVSTKDVQVSVPAEVLDVQAISDTTANEGSTFVQAISFTDPTDQNSNGWTYSIDWGDGTVQNDVSIFSRDFNIAHNFSDDGVYDVTVTVSDDVNGQTDTETFTVTVGDVAPTVNLHGGGSVNEGAVYSLTASVFEPGDDPIQEFVIDWGDGTVETISGDEFGTQTHVYSDGPFGFNISVDVVNDDGTFENAGTQFVNVLNVAPSSIITGPTSVDEGSEVTYTFGDIVDPGDDTIANTVIDWGDGTTTAYTGAGEYGHTFADGNATRSIRLLVTDEDADPHVAATLIVDIEDVAPSINVSGASETDEGSVYTLTLADLVEPGDDPVSEYLIDWGDGSAVQSVTELGDVTHTFADGNSSATISVQIVNDEGTFDGGTVDVTINNVAPTLALTGALTSIQNTAYTLNLGAIIDPGDDTIVANGITVNWGDGTTETYSSVGDVSHTYTTVGDFTISVSLEDEDGTFSDVATQAVSVSAPADTVDVASQADAVIDEGDTFTRTINFTDGEDNGAAGYTVDIDWDNDGNVDETFATTSSSFDVSKVFADGASVQTVSITVTDEAGESDTEAFDVTVDNVAPVSSISGPIEVNEGTEAIYTFGDILDPGDDTVANAVIEWGDGTTTAYTGAGDYSHTYADGDSSPVISLIVTDEDGTYTAASLGVAVNDVAPSITVSGASETDEGSVYTLTLADLVEPGDDPVSEYLIDWGDGSAVQSVTELGDVTHTFADGNSSATISVQIVNDEGTFDGGTVDVTINNVAPTLALTGALTSIQNTAYTLNLGAIIDPGDDTIVANGITVNWGDGTTETYSSVGDVSHTYTTVGDFTISVSLEDEDGTFSDVATQAVSVSAPADTIDVAAQGNAAIDEGDTFTRTINFTDGEDNGAADYTVDIDWDNDGNVDESFATTSNSFDVSKVFADGASTQTVSITVTDEAGESDTEVFDVTVNNVAPVSSISGPIEVNEGTEAIYTFGDILDPGDDTVANAVIEWGDGTTTAYTGAGDYSHTYADGDSSPVISLIVTDEDGTYTAASLGVAVNDVAPSITVSGASETDEGSVYTLTLADLVEPGDDPVSEYLIDWGDGSAVQSVTELGDVTHTFADGNSSATISVQIVNDEGTFDGGTVDVTINNVAPTTSVSSAAIVDANAPFTINFGEVVDPGDDTISNAVINWGDGTTSVYTGAGDYVHSYDGTITNPTIALLITDEDGEFVAASTTITVNEEISEPTATGSIQEFTLRDQEVQLDLQISSEEPVLEVIVDWGDGTSESFNDPNALLHEYGDLGLYDVSVQLVTASGTYDVGVIDDVDVGTRLGDVPAFFNYFDPNAWQNGWTDEGITLAHKSNTADLNEAWSAMSFVGWDSWRIEGQDVAFGHLGVSGRTSQTGSFFQQLDGTEGIRFNIDTSAMSGEIMFTDLYANESGNLDEQARVQFFDESGILVDEYLVTGSASGEVSMSFTTQSAFDYFVVTAGAYDGNGQFVYGSYADDNGVAASGEVNTGSELLIDAIQVGFRGSDNVVNVADELLEVTPDAMMSILPIPEFISAASELENSSGATPLPNVVTMPEQTENDVKSILPTPVRLVGASASVIALDVDAAAGDNDNTQQVTLPAYDKDVMSTLPVVSDPVESDENDSEKVSPDTNKQLEDTGAVGSDSAKAIEGKKDIVSTLPVVGEPIESDEEHDENVSVGSDETASGDEMSLLDSTAKIMQMDDDIMFTLPVISNPVESDEEHDTSALAVSSEPLTAGEDTPIQPEEESIEVKEGIVSTLPVVPDLIDAQEAPSESSLSLAGEVGENFEFDFAELSTDSAGMSKAMTLNYALQRGGQSAALTASNEKQAIIAELALEFDDSENQFMQYDDYLIR